MSLYRNFLNVGAMTLLSRIAGFVRDMLMASVLGTSIAADAFFAAFRFPNLFRRLFAEGAFNPAFVPLFTGALEQLGPDAARALATRIISWLIVFLTILTIVAEIFMPSLLVPFVPGFLDDPEKFELTVFLTRICFPYLACMSLMAAYGAILNGLGKFIIAAFAPVLLNIVLVITLVILILTSVNDLENAAMWISIGTLLGGVAQLALVTWAVRKTGFLPRFTLPRFDDDTRRFWALALPAIATGGITQINIFIGTIIASGAASAISYLYYADRLYQLPLGIIGIAIGIVLLPELSRHLKAGRLEEARATQDQSLLFALLLSLPATAGLIALSEPIIRLLFERGAFTAIDTGQTATALTAFAFGLPAFVLIKVFQPGFFAREDTMTPTIFAGVSVVTNIALSLLLFASYRHVGIAIATTIAAWSNALLLAITLIQRGHFTITARQLRRYVMIIVTSALMGLALWLVAMPLAPYFSGQQGVLVHAATLIGAIIVGALTYFLVLHLTGVQRLGDFARALKSSK